MRGETEHPRSHGRGNLYFNPLPSCEGRHTFGTAMHWLELFQYTPLMRGETLQFAKVRVHMRISIHSPHARGDGKVLRVNLCEEDFNPLPSCEGRLKPYSVLSNGENFNPLPSCEGRQGDAKASDSGLKAISIHSPHARGDSCRPSSSFVFPRFQSTPLMRGETQQIP